MDCPIFSNAKPLSRKGIFPFYNWFKTHFSVKLFAKKLCVFVSSRLDSLYDNKFSYYSVLCKSSYIHVF